MWMSNIAMTAMMLPIAKSILLEIEAHSLKHHQATNVEGSVQNVDTNYVKMTNTASTGADTSSDGEGEHTIDTNKSEASTNDGTKQQASPVQKQSRKCCVKIPANAATPDDRLSHQPSTTQVAAAFRRLSKGLYLSIAYSANIGSTATLTGSGSIRILAGDLLRYASDQLCTIIEYIYMSACFGNACVCVVCFQAVLESVLGVGLPLLPRQ